MEEAYELCDEIAIIDHGRIIAHGAPDALLAKHFDDVVVQIPEEDIPPQVGEAEFEVTYRNSNAHIVTGDVNRTIEKLLSLEIPLDRLRIRARDLERPVSGIDRQGVARLMWNRIYALFVARNTEFFRDKAALTWSILLPILIIFVFAYAFTDENPEKFKVAIVLADQLNPPTDEFKSTRFIKFIEVEDIDASLHKIERHQVDMLFDTNTRRYWINQTSPNGYIVEKLLIAAFAGSDQKLNQNLVQGDEVRYLDWVIPGVIAMNMMWGALFGIGYVIVRYRKMGVLKRLRATPVTPVEFLTAQIMSRLWLLLVINVLIYIGMDYFVDFRMNGSYLDLFIVFTLGCICLICCGLVIAARISSEEVANGLLNLMSWPMMFLSGIWFSLEGAHPWMQKFALILPLTHVTKAAREIMIDGAGLLQVADHLLVLGLTSVVLLVIGARIFRWE